MEDEVARLRLKFDSFMKNEESALTVRKEAYLALDKARRMGRNDIVDEVVYGSTRVWDRGKYSLSR